MKISRLRARCGACLATFLVFSAPAYAMRQCPVEFGQKNPIIDVLGWLVVSIGIVVGGVLFAYLIRRSRGMRWLSYAVVSTLGLAGMLLVWVGGFALAFVYFFFTC